MTASSSHLPLEGVDAAILVGGAGTRLRGVVDDVPKPLAPVSGRPFLFYLLDLLALRGARTITLCSGYLAGQVEEAVGLSWLGMPVFHSRETIPMGTGGALALARKTLKSSAVLVINGDTWCEPDFVRFRAAAKSSVMCIASAHVENASRYGTLAWGTSGRLVSFTEKSSRPTAGSINAGVYLVSQCLLGTLPPSPCSLERDILPSLTMEGRVKVFPTSSEFLDMGIPEDYASAPGFFQKLGISPHSMFPDSPCMDFAVPKVGTCVVILDDDGKILMERRSDCGWWGLPGGRLDAGETIAQGAAREAFEETGLEIEITGFLGLFSDPRRRTVRYPDNSDLRQLVDAAVLARQRGGTLTKSHESLELKWFKPSDIPIRTVPPVIEMLRHAWNRSATAVLC